MDDNGGTFEKGKRGLSVCLLPQFFPCHVAVAWLQFTINLKSTILATLPGVFSLVYRNCLIPWGAWVAQLVKWLTSAQIMISRFMSLSPSSRPVLTTQSLEPASDSVSPSFSTYPPLVLSLSKINIKKKLKKKKKKSN